MLTLILNIVNYLLTILSYLVIVHVILSLLVNFNVVNLRNEFVRVMYDGLERFLAPFYRPFQRLLPQMGGLDWSPFLLLITLNIVQNFVLPFLANPTLI